MTKHNENNERIKRTYFAYLKEAQRHSEQSIDAVSTASPASKHTTAIATSRLFITNRPSDLNVTLPSNLARKLATS